MVDMIIDGNSLFARSFYAVMTSPQHSPQEAVRAAICTVLSLLNTDSQRLDDKVDRLLFAWDGKNKRDKGRDPKPPHYHETRELLLEYLTVLFNPTHAMLPAHEADDVVATAVAQSDADDIFVISGDKDLQQLAGDHVHYYCLNHKLLMSLRQIRDRWTVKRPEQVAVALAILGDKVDNIQGIKGWGPKKVKTLFETVTPDMDLEQAVLTIDAQIPPELQNQFYGDLELTLLRRDLPGVAQASPIELAPLKVVEELQLPNFMGFYRPVFNQRMAHVPVDIDGDAEDAPSDDY